MRVFSSASRMAIAVAIFATLLPAPCRAAEEESRKPEKAEATPATITVSGVVEAVAADEITADTEQVGPLEIARIIDHGTRVTKGQNLVWFDTEAIDKKIREAETSLRLSRLALEGEEFSHRQALAREEIERTKAARVLARARQAFDNFMTVDRERQIASAEFDVTNATALLENATEELEQLEQMYKEDDLTEESEEIVLKRAKQAVETARFRLEGVEIASRRTISQAIPEAEADQHEALRLAELAHEKTIRELAATRSRREIELGRKQEALREDEENLAELKEERRRMVLQSPADGIALLGPLTRARLGDKPSPLKAGSSVTADQVLLTVVDPTRLQIRLDLDEKHLGTLREGDRCTVLFPALPGHEARGRVKHVSRVPYAGTKYDCVVTLNLKKIAWRADLIPLMTAELTFTVAEDAEAPAAE